MIHPFINIIAFTLGENSTSILCVTRPVVTPPCSLHMQVITQGRNPRDIVNVRKPSSESSIPFDTNYLIRKKMSMNAAIVVKLFPMSQLRK